MTSSELSLDFPTRPAVLAARAADGFSPLHIAAGRTHYNARQRVAAGLFLAVNASLFIRPGDLFAALQEIPIYEVSVLLCLVLSLPELVKLTQAKRLQSSPVLVCVALLLPAVALSHAIHLSLRATITSTIDFSKLFVYFALLLAIIDSTSRLEWFLIWLLRLIVAATGLALLTYAGVIDLAALAALDHRERDEAGDVVDVVKRLRGAGIFNDPNDLCLILCAGTSIALYRFHTGRWKTRLAAIVAIAILLLALVLTRSRGGLLAMIATIGVVSMTRIGWKRTVLLGILGVPLLPLALVGRQATINLNEDTAQSRIQLWADGINFVRSSPLFGIGFGQFAEESSDVAHNSYLHTYAELGFFGGTLFFGSFFLALDSMRRIDTNQQSPAAKALTQLRPCVAGLIAGYATGVFSLSRPYMVPTYLVFGLGASFMYLATSTGQLKLRFDRKLMTRLTGASAACLVGIYVLVKVFVRFG